MQAGKHYPHQEHVASYYAATRNDNQQWPELSGELNAEVCIIGGGFSGLNTAINLAEAGYKVVLLEANRIGWGASGRNGGQLIRGIGHDTSQFARWIGAEGVRELDLMGLEAVELVRERSSASTSIATCAGATAISPPVSAIWPGLQRRRRIWRVSATGMR